MGLTTLECYRTMNIFHQLRTGGDPDMKDVYAEVPWIEFKEYPGQSDEELLERWKVRSSQFVWEHCH